MFTDDTCTTVTYAKQHSVSFFVASERISVDGFLTVGRPAWHFGILAADPHFGHMLRFAALVLLTSQSFMNNISANYI